VNLREKVKLSLGNYLRILESLNPYYYVDSTEDVYFNHIGIIVYTENIPDLSYSIHKTFKDMFNFKVEIEAYINSIQVGTETPVSTKECDYRHEVVFNDYATKKEVRIFILKKEKEDIRDKDKILNWKNLLNDTFPK
jgi:hypothetical protein